MPSTRTRTLLLLALLLALLAVLAGQAWQRLLAEQGISAIEWQGPGLSRDGLRLQQLDVRQEKSASHMEIHAEGLSLGWPRRIDGRWRLGAVELQRLRLAAWPDTAAPAEQGGWPDPERVGLWLGLLPQRIELPRAELELPCASGQRCQLAGSLHWQQLPGNTAQLAAELVQGAQRLAVAGELRPRQDAWQLNLAADLDGARLAELDAEWLPGERRWRGNLASPGVPPLDAVRAWLAPWLPTPTLAIALPEAGRLRLSWDSLLGGDGPWPDWPGLRDSQGELELAMQLPQPWPLPGLGSLQGDLQLQASAATSGQWRPKVLDGDLYLSDLYGDWLQALPVGLRPASLRLALQPDDSAPGAVRLDLRGKGASDLRLQGVLALVEGERLALALSQGRLQGQVADLQFPGLRLGKLALDLPLDGEIGQAAAQLRLGKAAKLSLASLTGPQAIKAGKLSVTADQATLALGYAQGQAFSLGFDGAVQLAVGELRQAQLKPLAWSYQGQLSAGLAQQRLKGRLQNSGGLSADVELQHAADGGLQLSAQVPEFFLRTGNPLAASLAAWPELLSLNNGRLRGSVDWKLPPAGAQQLALVLNGNGLDGVYDRSEIHGLDAEAKVQLRGNDLLLQLPSLKVAQLNPGVPLGPLQFQGDYSASLARPLAGRLDWRQLELQLFGGRAWLDAGTLRPAAENPAQNLHLEGVLLEQILKAYPAEGLAGNGILDGQLPLLIGPDGLSVKGGQVAARQPGVLQFRSEKIRALGQSNPAMQLVATMLDDFRYERLASSVDYARNGRLLLGLAISGRNPALEDGRPVNLNVNLEENIPDLLTSLQLSDRVSDVIRKRVQDRLRNKPPAAP
ncbi:YdbH domain-containing protein [Pseudomonas citronellolis]|uniref:YdbH domain-containing protein n=1 Tax=Pseudomonas citronellolis TaxID=53408 RepID=UPI0023E3BAAC|nr:YdbH domain-containing protein [Pseudomonas citronellolis]MDF3932488.1 YdbH domain-containing protein [Pseudomonas citronellolis]